MKLMIRHRGKVHPKSKNPGQVDTNCLQSEKENPNPTEIKDEKEMIKSEAPDQRNVSDKKEKDGKKQVWAEYYPKHKEKIKERNILRHKRKRQESEKLKEKLEIKPEGDPRKSKSSSEMFG